METGTGRILSIRQTERGARQAEIVLEGTSVPAPGRYLQVHNLADADRPTALTLFAGGYPAEEPVNDRFMTAPPIPARWQPGDRLKVFGPLGRGFHLPEGTSRLTLASFGENSEHLLPLAGQILAQGGEVALCTDDPYPPLPAGIEINPLAGLAEAVHWADLTACSVPVERFSAFADQTGELATRSAVWQVLVYGEFPCAAMAACGVCAFRIGSRSYRLACQDGPVFDWPQQPT
jgi:hypothetical protein